MSAQHTPTPWIAVRAFGIQSMVGQAVVDELDLLDQAKLGDAASSFLNEAYGALVIECNFRAALAKAGTS